ncbi:MAG: PAS domain S-box protein [Planctomycetota bacterium]
MPIPSHELTCPAASPARQVADVFWTWDIPSNRTTFSDAWPRLLGYQDGEFDPAAHPWETLVCAEDLPGVMARIEALLAGVEPSYAAEYRVRTKSGDWVWVLSGGFVVERDESGKAIRMTGCLFDNTRTKELEARVRRHAALVTLLQRVAVTANESSDASDAMVEALRAVCEYTGWTAGHVYVLGPGDDELVSAGLWWAEDAERIHPLREATRSMRFGRGIGLPGRVWATGRPAWIPDVSREANFFRADACGACGVRAMFGVPVIAEGEVAAVLEFFAADPMAPGDELVRMLEQVGRQIGQVIERGHAARQLRESEAKFRRHFQNNPVPIYVWRRERDDFTLVDANDAARCLTKGRVDSLFGTRAGVLFADDPQICRELNACLRDGSPIRREMTHRMRTTGEEKRLVVQFVAIPPNLVMVHTEDITERHLSQTALRESEERFRAIVEHSRDGICLCTTDAVIRYVSPVVREIMGYGPEELMDRVGFDFVHPDDRIFFRERFAWVAERPGAHLRVETRVVHRCGSVRWLELTLTNFLETPGVQAIVANVWDITDRKESGQLLHAQREILEGIGRGRPREAILDQVCRCIEELIPGARCTVLRVDELETVLRFTSGPSIPPKLAGFLGALPIGPDMGSAGAAAFTGQMQIVADSSVDPRWAAFRPLAEEFDIRSCTATPVFGRDGGVIGTFGILRRERGEPSEFQLQALQTGSYLIGLAMEAAQSRDRQWQLETQLAEVGRRTVVGELAATLAHELNQPLAAVMNYAEVLRRGLQDKRVNVGKLDQIAAEIILMTDRAGRIISQARALMRKQPPRRERLDVHHCVDQVLELISTEARLQGVIVRCELDPTLPAADGDAIQVQQVLLNLLRNAVEAVQESAASQRVVVVRTGKSSNGWITVGVEDSGPGIKPEAISRVFEPFFSTKTGGLGMGLTISRSIVEAHKGRFRAIPNTPTGTVFEFTLPIASESPRIPEKRPPGALRGPER